MVLWVDKLVFFILDPADLVWSKIESLPDGSFQCQECPHLNRNKRAMFEHVESKHVQSDGYNCPVCEKNCRSLNALRSHTVRYHGSSSASKLFKKWFLFVLLKRFNLCLIKLVQALILAIHFFLLFRAGCCNFFKYGKKTWRELALSYVRLFIQENISC